jgi:hypothetical protein
MRPEQPQYSALFHVPRNIPPSANRHEATCSISARYSPGSTSKGSGEQNGRRAKSAASLSPDIAQAQQLRCFVRVARAHLHRHTAALATRNQPGDSTAHALPFAAFHAPICSSEREKPAPHVPRLQAVKLSGVSSEQGCLKLSPQV